MKCLAVVFAVCFAVCSAGIPDGYGDGHEHLFHGRYEDKCGKDGFYYRDHNSFVICSNGNAYEQPCAPGSRNSAYDHYRHGNHYYYRDFCDVNLVDYGAGIPPHGYDGHRGNGVHGYGHDVDDHAYTHGYHGYGDRHDGHGHDDRHDDAHGYNQK